MLKKSPKVLFALSIVSFGIMMVAPAYAGSVQAYISGSSAIVLMNGASQSIGAEVAAPNGSSFDGSTATTGNLLVLPVLAPGLSPSLSLNTARFARLTVNAGIVEAAPAGSSFTAAAATKLTAATTAADLSAQVSLIRAGAGIDGLD